MEQRENVATIITLKETFGKTKIKIYRSVIRASVGTLRFIEEWFSSRKIKLKLQIWEKKVLRKIRGEKR